MALFNHVGLDAVIADENDVNQVVGFLILFAYYFANYFVIIFFNSALIACAIIRFKGGNPNLKDGFSAAVSRLPRELKAPLETEKNVFGRFLKNDYGRGGLGLAVLDSIGQLEGRQ